uniref:APC family permease n=1 Tax=Algoriphagus sp. TaxID=1872435 RepID=UPI0040479DEA
MDSNSSTLNRSLGLVGLTATGVCSMIGASIYVVPFMIQRNVPGIGPYVLPAFLFASIPAIFAALAYSILSSAMPRAGGSYLYASRALHPFWGFVASFSQWFGLSIVIGVIAYVVIPFFRDLAFALDWTVVAAWLDQGLVRVVLALVILWSFIGINILGLTFYERILIPLMVLMFVLGMVVIGGGLSYSQEEFLAALAIKEGRSVDLIEVPFNWITFLSASAILFSSFIGFDSIAQAGGEAKNPVRNLPRAIGLAITVVGLFYVSFTYAVYHTVPWQFVAEEALSKDLTAAGMLTMLLPAGIGIAILLGAAIALLNDLPAMILSVSRLVFAWAEDGIFPKSLAGIHPKFHTPVPAILLSGGVSSLGILGSHFAGDFFLGIDIMVTSMLVNFIFMCLSVAWLPKRNPTLAQQITIFPNKVARAIIVGIGSVFLSCFLVIHTYKDLTSLVDAWYFHSTWIWLIVMGMAAGLFFIRWTKLKKTNSGLLEKFSKLP